MKKFNHWQVAYRKGGEGEFKLLQNPSYGWAADPFLVRYRGNLYLFAEIFLCYSERNGVIGYCKYEEDNWSDWTVTMDKHFHLSYPNVFVVDDELYMCPESHQNEEVALYKLIDFPDKWTKVKTLIINEKYVDTTFLQNGHDIYMFTFKPSFCNSGGQLLMLKKSEIGWEGPVFITGDKAIARPGGNFFEKGGKLFRVSQNSVKEYGNGLVISEVREMWPRYKEVMVKSVFPNDLRIAKTGRCYTGIHTYNVLENIEVIDVKYQTSSIREWSAQKRVRKVFMNKYNGGNNEKNYSFWQRMVLFLKKD